MTGPADEDDRLVVERLHVDARPLLPDADQHVDLGVRPGRPTR